MSLIFLYLSLCFNHPWTCNNSLIRVSKHADKIKTSSGTCNSQENTTISNKMYTCVDSPKFLTFPMLFKGY